MKNEQSIILEERQIQNKAIKLSKILMVLFLPYLSLSLGQSGFLGLFPFIREEFDLTRAEVGYYSTFFFISAAFLSVFTGSIVDNLGPKKTMLMGIGWLGLLFTLHGLSPSYHLLLIMAFLAGFGFSIITPSATKAIMIATPQEKRAFSMGFTQSGFGLGGILGASLLPFLGEKLGWRLAIQIAAALILLTGLFVYQLYQEQKEIRIVIDTPEDQKGKWVSFKKRLKSIFVCKYLLRMCMMGLLFGIMESAVLAHFVVFLSEDLKISKISAGFGLAILHLGGMFGLLGWGILSDRLFKIDRRLSLFLIGLSAGVMYLIFGFYSYYVSVNKMIVFILTFLFGFSALSWSGVYYTTIGEIAGSKKAGMSTGLAMFFIRIGMLVAPPIFGLIADANGYYMYSWVIFGFIIIAVSSLFLQKNE